MAHGDHKLTCDSKISRGESLRSPRAPRKHLARDKRILHRKIHAMLVRATVRQQNLPAYYPRLVETEANHVSGAQSQLQRARPHLEPLHYRRLFKGHPLPSNIIFPE